MTKAIVVDDEVILIDHLLRILDETWPQLEVVGKASSGEEALVLFDKHDADLLFLDIQMPGMSGLEVAKRVADTAQVIFVTAFNQYAIEAFESAAFDYILKPATVDRVAKSVERIKSKHFKSEASLRSDELKELMEKLSVQKPEPWLQWLRTGCDTKTEMISVDEVIYFESNNKYTSVYTTHNEYLVRTSIDSLSKSLNPNQFWRIHRGIIVKVSEIREAHRDIRGRYLLSLKNCSTRLRSSQRYGHLFKLSR